MAEFYVGPHSGERLLGHDALGHDGLGTHPATALLACRRPTWHWAAALREGRPLDPEDPNDSWRYVQLPAAVAQLVTGRSSRSCW